MVGCAWPWVPTPTTQPASPAVGLSHKALASSWWQRKAGLGPYRPQHRSGKGPRGGAGGSCLHPVV